MRGKLFSTVCLAWFSVKGTWGWSNPSLLVPPRGRNSNDAATNGPTIRRSVAAVNNLPPEPNFSPASATSTTPTTTPVWIVYVDHSKSSLEKGAAATLDAFLGLTTVARQQRGIVVEVKAAFLPKPKGGGSPPWVRCVSLPKNVALEVYGVDSVDKVYRVLTKHMTLNVSLDLVVSMKKDSIPFDWQGVLLVS